MASSSSYSFHCAGPHPVRLHQYEAIIMPKDIARVFGTLKETFSASPEILAGCATLRDVRFVLSEPSDAEKGALRGYFGDSSQPVMAVTMPVKQALLAKFGPTPDPVVVGSWLGLDKPMHIIVPYTGRDPSKKGVVIYDEKGVVFSTGEAELVTSPFPGDVTFPEPAPAPAPAPAISPTQ